MSRKKRYEEGRMLKSLFFGGNAVPGWTMCSEEALSSYYHPSYSGHGSWGLGSTSILRERQWILKTERPPWVLLCIQWIWVCREQKNSFGLRSCLLICFMYLLFYPRQVDYKTGWKLATKWMCGLCNESQSAVLSEASETDTEEQLLSTCCPKASQHTSSPAALGWAFDGKTRDKCLARLEQKEKSKYSLNI